MIVEPLVPQYQSLLSRFLWAEDELEREVVLMAVDTLARGLLPVHVSMDEMLALHARAKSRLTEIWAQCPAGSREQQSWQKLARGDGMPVMLALLLPQQVEEHRLAERRWRAEHARLAAVFEQTDDLVLMFDAADRIEYLNPAFTRATGWTLLSAQAHPSAVWREALPLSGTLHVETEQRCADGRFFPASWSISPILDEDGGLLDRVCIGRDISQQRQIDDALQQNDRLRAVATLAAGVAHDFNNVLGSIQGLTEVCQAVADPGSLMARNLAGIHRASLRAAELVSQLLSFAREQPSIKTEVEVGAWLSGLETLLGASLPKTVQLRWGSTAGLRIHADAAQLEQVLLNLVKNAGYAMRETGGEVGLQADLWHDPAEQAWVRIRVIDHGEGIPADVLPRIFDPFFTTKPVDEGTGLGLSAAYGIVRQHQGELRVESAPGQPTTFTLLLPRVEGAVGPIPVEVPPLPMEPAAVASWYDVDGAGRVCAVSPDWDGFAHDNGGPAAVADRVLGRPLLDFIGGDATQRFVSELIAGVRLTHRARRSVYRCDSPAMQRTIELTLEPREGGAVRLHHRLVAQQPRRSVKGAAVTAEEDGKGRSKWLRCSQCLKLRLRVQEGEAEWIRPRLGDGVEIPRPVEDVVCERCATEMADEVHSITH